MVQIPRPLTSTKCEPPCTSVSQLQPGGTCPWRHGVVAAEPVRIGGAPYVDKPDLPRPYLWSCCPVFRSHCPRGVPGTLFELCATCSVLQNPSRINKTRHVLFMTVESTGEVLIASMGSLWLLSRRASGSSSAMQWPGAVAVSAGCRLSLPCGVEGFV